MVRERQKLPLPAGFPRGWTVLTVGRWAAHERYKGADALIRAVAALHAAIPDVQLVAVGSGDDLPRLRAFAAELKIEDRVHFLEKLTDEEVAACYAHANYLRCPARRRIRAGVSRGHGLWEAGGRCRGRRRNGYRSRRRKWFPRASGRYARLSDALRKLLEDGSLRANWAKLGGNSEARIRFRTFRSRLAEF